MGRAFSTGSPENLRGSRLDPLHLQLNLWPFMAEHLFERRIESIDLLRHPSGQVLVETGQGLADKCHHETKSKPPAGLRKLLIELPKKHARLVSHK
jgi:hypothetical protein